MTKFFTLLALFLLLGCKKQEIEQKSLNQLEIIVNNTAITFEDNTWSGNSNCNRIFINGSVLSQKAPFMCRLQMDLTADGRVREVVFFDYSDQNRHYKTVDFISSSNFSLQNFQFDPFTRNLSFDFAGTLYEVDDPQHTKPISGKVRINQLQDIACSYTPWTIKALINQKVFQKVDMWGRWDEVKSQWVAISDEGTWLSIVTTQPLRNMPTGTYPFKRSDLMNRVEIKKYVGPYKATMIGLLNEEEWEKYEYEGTLTIEQQQSLPEKSTKGTFHLKAYKDNQVVYEVTNGTFSI
jgi:hypothetical protein